MTSRATNVLYWISTGLLVALNLEGGVANAMRTESTLQVIHALGYPSYFAAMLGVAKLLGVAAIALPVPRVLREWAYAGFAFDVIAAIISLAVVGPVSWVLAIPAFCLAIVLVSYWTWRKRESLSPMTPIAVLGSA
jgi:hypothetical protein